MQKFRIGEVFAVHWSILTNGDPLPLAGRDLKLILHAPSYIDIELDFETEDNIAIFRILPEVQKMLGVYSLTMYENYGTDIQSVVDCCHAFTLVSNTCEKHEKCKIADLETSCLRIGYVGGSVVQYNNKFEFPNVGDSHLLYIDISTNKSYRWDTDTMQYYCVAADYNDISIIDSGDASELNKEIY